MALSEDQEYIFEKYKQGENVFITGPGGCGKTHLLKHIVNDAAKNGKQLSTCALTGCAAYLLGCRATTVHRWASIGLATGDRERIIQTVAFTQKKARNWRKTQILVVDEVSMMSKYLFELLDDIGRAIRQPDKPFGGIQLIFSGDFHQLPPVGSYKNPDTTMFCFESNRWSSSFDTQMELIEIFRQTNEKFINILHEIRRGIITKKSCSAIRKRMKISPPEHVCPVKICPIKKTVHRINQIEMSKLTNVETMNYEYKASYIEIDAYKTPTKKQMEMEEKYLLKSCMFDSTLTLKKGCQVMCIANLDVGKGLMNGSTGIVTDFIDGMPQVKFRNGVKHTFASHEWKSDTVQGFGILQLPLILAWAITVHKTQGATLDCAEMDLGCSIFACGQTYVALSRVKDINSLYVTSFDPSKIRVNEKVKKFYSMFEDADDDGDDGDDDADGGDEALIVP